MRPIWSEPGRATRASPVADLTATFRPVDRQFLQDWAQRVADLVRRAPYWRRHWTVHIGVGAGPVTDAAGEPARSHLVEAVLKVVRPIFDAALGAGANPDLAATITVRYKRHNGLAEAPAAASNVTAAPTGGRVVLWLDHVADLPSDDEVGGLGRSAGGLSDRGASLLPPPVGLTRPLPSGSPAHPPPQPVAAALLPPPPGLEALVEGAEFADVLALTDRAVFDRVPGGGGGVAVGVGWR